MRLRLWKKLAGRTWLLSRSLQHALNLRAAQGGVREGADIRGIMLVPRLRVLLRPSENPLLCACVCVCDLYFERWILVQRWAGHPIWLRSAEAAVER